MDRHSHGQIVTPPPVVDADAPIARYAAELPELPNLSESRLRTPCSYRGYRELLESWASLDKARAQMIGRSVQGEPLWMVELGNPNASKVSVVIGGIHPIEWIGVETVFQLAAEHAVDPCVDRRVLFFPLANPDGFRLVEENLRAGRRRWVRANANGVDLNRNWPTHFRFDKGLFGGNMFGHNASGPAPLSEPEIAAIVETLDEVAKSSEIDVAVSLHSIGKMLLMPWGGKWERTADYERHVRAARGVRRHLKASFEGPYTIRQGSHWVPGVSMARGMEMDHLYKAYGATTLLVECTRGELGVARPQVLLDPFRIFNPRKGRSRAAIIAHALDGFVRGRF